jgi:hypothetical protein
MWNEHPGLNDFGDWSAPLALGGWFWTDAWGVARNRDHQIFRSADGAVHRVGEAAGRLERCHTGGNMARAFSPQSVVRFVTWGVASGWFEGAPLALRKATWLSVLFEAISSALHQNKAGT